MPRLVRKPGLLPEESRSDLASTMKSHSPTPSGSSIKIIVGVANENGWTMCHETVDVKQAFVKALAAVLIIVLQHFSVDAGIISGLVHLDDAPTGEEAPLAKVRRAVW